MRRRELLAAVIAETPLSRQGFAQSTSRRISRVAFLGNASPSTVDPAQIAGFKQGLLENGLIEGSNVDVQYFWIEGSLERMQKLAAELSQGNFDVILTAGSKAVQTLLATATKTLRLFLQ